MYTLFVSGLYTHIQRVTSSHVPNSSLCQVASVEPLVLTYLHWQTNTSLTSKIKQKYVMKQSTLVCYHTTRRKECKAIQILFIFSDV